MLSYVAKHSNQRKTAKLIKLQLLASILSRNDKQCWVTSQNIQNNAKLQKWSNYNDLHRFDVKTIKNRRKTFKNAKLQSIKIQLLASIRRRSIKNFAISRKTFKTTQNYKSDQITMNLHRFDVKTIKTSQN